MQIMVKQWPEMVEARSRYDPPKVNFGTPRKDQKMTNFLEVSRGVRGGVSWAPPPLI